MIVRRSGRRQSHPGRRHRRRRRRRSGRRSATPTSPMASWTIQIQQESPAIADGALPRSSRAAYLRVAHMYMLISIPTDTSTIFGAFQAIAVRLGLIWRRLLLRIQRTCWCRRGHFRVLTDLSKKSKIEELRKSRESRIFDVSLLQGSCRTDSAGPWSFLCEMIWSLDVAAHRNAPAALKNFVGQIKKKDFFDSIDPLRTST